MSGGTSQDFQRSETLCTLTLLEKTPFNPSVAQLVSDDDLHVKIVGLKLIKLS